MSPVSNIKTLQIDGRDVSAEGIALLGAER